jgi:hypothetical protein
LFFPLAVNRDRFATPFRANADPHRTPLRGYAESAFAPP